MGPICIGFSFFFFFDCLLLFYLGVVSTCAIVCLVLLIDGFMSLILYFGFFFFIYNHDVFLLHLPPLGVTRLSRILSFQVARLTHERFKK
jgi:hypothetical protein